MNLDFTHLSSSDSTYIDSMYENYKNDPNSIDVTWVKFFQGMEGFLQLEEIASKLFFYCLSYPFEH